MKKKICDILYIPHLNPPVMSQSLRTSLTLHRKHLQPMAFSRPKWVLREVAYNAGLLWSEKLTSGQLTGYVERRCCDGSIMTCLFALYTTEQTLLAPCAIVELSPDLTPVICAGCACMSSRSLSAPSVQVINFLFFALSCYTFIRQFASLWRAVFGGM